MNNTLKTFSLVRHPAHATDGTAPRVHGLRGVTASGIAAIALLGSAILLSAPGYALDWVEITPLDGDAPVARSNAAAIYDGQNHRMIVFGGEASSGHLNDVWSFDLNANRWLEITPSAGQAPAPRRTPNVVYDPERHRMIIWSGQGASFFNDVWAFDLIGETWTEFEPPGPKPNIRYGAASIFDPLARSLVTFAGFTNEGRFDDTWRFDVENGAWMEVSPSEGSPGKRCLHSASYDIQGHRMIMYGGQRTGALGDLWAFDLGSETWTELTPEDRPEGRFFVANVYDAQSRRVIVFGGNRGASGKTNELWAYDLSANTWQKIEASGEPPGARDGTAAIYIASENRMVLFGGSGDVFLNDVWSLNGLLRPAPTAVQDLGGSVAPSRFVLHQNHPNPFNSRTAIRYDLPRSTRVALKVHDLLGQEVRTLVEETQTAGYKSVTWDGKNRLGHPVSSGVYVYRLETSDVSRTRKLLLMK